jgi:hypothetical protein
MDRSSHENIPFFASKRQSAFRIFMAHRLPILYIFGMRTNLTNAILKLMVMATTMIPLLAFSLLAAQSQSSEKPKITERGKAAVQKIIFEEQKIEGKIRRPQMVLIKADQRPAFPPMIMQSAGKNDNVASSIDPSLLESPAYKGAFKFQGTAITNYVP